jgi:hypothetical protein
MLQEPDADLVRMSIGGSHCLLLARTGHGAMADLSPLLGEERKSDFGAVRSVEDPTRTSAGKYMLDRSIAFRASSLPLHCGGLIHGAFGMERREFIALVGGGDAASCISDIRVCIACRSLGA